MDSQTEAIRGALAFWDWLVVGVYFLFTLWIGLYFGRRQTSSDHYFMANRRVPGWAVGMSIFATVISSWAFLALPGKAFKSDIQYLMSVIPVLIAIPVACVLIVPIYRNKVRLSAYEYLERRFGLAARCYGSITFVTGHFFKMSMVLYLLCLAIAGMTGWDVHYLIFFVGLLTIVYTFVGGVEGVIWTDVAQGFLMLISAVVSMGFLLWSLPGGPGEITNHALEAGKFRIADFSFDWTKESVYILFIFGFIQFMGKYSTDQTVVQRYLLAPSAKQAARALRLSIYLLLFVWLNFMVLGCLLWSFYDINSDLLPASVRAKPDQVFAYFIGHQMPPGISGLILAGILAASMSTVASDLNSLGSVLLDDFYNKAARNTNDRRRLFFSKMSVLVSGILGIGLAMTLTRFESMVEAAFMFSSIMAGGLMGLFFLGFFTRRCSTSGAYIGLVAGVAFITWATLTNGMDTATLPWLPKFTIHIYWLGLLGNVVVFVSGYLASLVFTPHHRTDKSLTVYSTVLLAVVFSGIVLSPSPLHAFTPPPGTVWEEALPVDAPLDIEWVGETSSEGISMRRLRYTGSVWKGDPQRIYALYGRPEGTGPFPAILQIHGGGQTCFPANVAYFVNKGYACLSFDWTGPRDNRPAEEITNWPPGLLDGHMGPETQEPGQNLVHQAVLAAIRGLDVLSQQPEVNASCMGVQGISWGGYITWLVNGLDERIKAAVPTYGVGGISNQWSGLAASIKKRETSFGSYWKKHYEPEVFASSQHGPVLFLNATNDFFGQLPQAEERLGQLLVPHRRSYAANRMHSLDPESVTAAMAWFDSLLKGDDSFPAEPLLNLVISPEGALQAVILADELMKVVSVRVDYSRGGAPPLSRCWLTQEADSIGAGKWCADLPIIESLQPVSALAQVIYEGEFMLTSPLREVVPAMDLSGGKGTVVQSTVLCDWGNGPSGWFIQRGTDFEHADPGETKLALDRIGDHDCLVCESEEPLSGIHLATRLIADPARIKGGTSSLEIWTHDLTALTIRTNGFLCQPGAKAHQAQCDAGPGWVKSVLRIDGFKSFDEQLGKVVESGGSLAVWNDVRQLGLTASVVPGGKPAIGLMKWAD